MADLTSLKQLDTVLNSLKDHPEEIGLGNLRDRLSESGSVFNIVKLRKLVHKLVDDGFVRQGNVDNSLYFNKERILKDTRFNIWLIFPKIVGWKNLKMS